MEGKGDLYKVKYIRNKTNHSEKKTNGSKWSGLTEMRREKTKEEIRRYSKACDVTHEG